MRPLRNIHKDLVVSPRLGAVLMRKFYKGVHKAILSAVIAASMDCSGVPTVIVSSPVHHGSGRTQVGNHCRHILQVVEI
ncbi:hypothetical protein N7471_013489 [Penicillium samsonianum]|uniref:uncharacterized protein n=1 Tax=Penicillium samsonianum TaxID=1882272 RepID=UPI002547DA90|nr:uncharacterized protein N7471_013489 [Penicillium samsonianum]KAJ6118869.1 hypothetical protein N7471_013489 [Penicillium samsonianum]